MTVVDQLLSKHLFLKYHSTVIITKVHSLCPAGMLFAMYVLCMYALYSFMPVVVRMTSATAVNLSLLTADLFSLFCGLFLFRYTVSVLKKHAVYSWLLVENDLL